MKLPFNKFTLLALAWLAAGIYALLFKESGNEPPPFAHFDKVAHCALFFAQIWLLAKAWLHERRPVPYRSLLAFALVYAAASEWAQATFTLTRQGSLGDLAADMAGAGLALWLAHRVSIQRNIPTTLTPSDS